MIETNDEDDEPAPLEKKKRPEEEMDITPMIDITFLLLIFFVVTSKMDPTKMGEIPKAENGLAISAKDSAVIIIQVGSGDSALLSRMSGLEFSKDEDTQTAEIVEYITEELKAGKNHVMIMGDENVKVGEVTRVQKVIGDAFADDFETDKLSFTYIAVKEE
jgi:biopolymer transport protein ExbD